MLNRLSERTATQKIYKKRGGWVCQRTEDRGQHRKVILLLPVQGYNIIILL